MMAVNTHLVDGTQGLDPQERALNFIEQATFAKVISYSKKGGNVPSGTKPNEAVLQDVPIGQQPGPLHLEALDSKDDPTSIITKHLQAGKVVVFHDIGYVSGEEQMILGFR
jgi:hypothetical protein